MDDRFVEVPCERLEPEILRNLIEEYIERDGTSYGVTEIPTDKKFDMVIAASSPVKL